MPQYRYTAAAIKRLWECMEDLSQAFHADQTEGMEPPPRRNRFLDRLPLFIAVPFFAAILCATFFSIGRDYQKEHGPSGSECQSGSMRSQTKDHLAGECVNGFWFEWAPR